MASKGDWRLTLVPDLREWLADRVRHRQVTEDQLGTDVMAYVYGETNKPPSLDHMASVLGEESGFISSLHRCAASFQSFANKARKLRSELGPRGATVARQVLRRIEDQVSFDADNPKAYGLVLGNYLPYATLTLDYIAGLVSGEGLHEAIPKQMLWYPASGLIGPLANISRSTSEDPWREVRELLLVQQRNVIRKRPLGIDMDIARWHWAVHWLIWLGSDDHQRDATQAVHQHPGKDAGMLRAERVGRILAGDVDHAIEHAHLVLENNDARSIELHSKLLHFGKREDFRARNQELAQNIPHEFRQLLSNLYVDQSRLLARTALLAILETCGVDAFNTLWILNKLEEATHQEWERDHDQRTIQARFSTAADKLLSRSIREVVTMQSPREAEYEAYYRGRAAKVRESQRELLWKRKVFEVHLEDGSAKKLRLGELEFVYDEIDDRVHMKRQRGIRKGSSMPGFVRAIALPSCRAQPWGMNNIKNQLHISDTMVYSNTHRFRDDLGDLALKRKILTSPGVHFGRDWNWLVVRRERRRRRV